MQSRFNYRQSYMTISILVVLFGVFIFETLNGGSENTATLLKMGAMNNLAVAQGQWWRLFAAQFLHIGIMHIASNAVMVLYMGQYIEPLIGHFRFLMIYLLSGIGGNLLSFALGNDNNLSAGASTALFGLFGAMIALGLANRNYPAISFLSRQAFALAFINLALDIFMPSIDILGHLGGLISGYLLTVVIGSNKLNNYNTLWKISALVALVIYTLWTMRTGMVIIN